jgi:hypothetical protein
MIIYLLLVTGKNMKNTEKQQYISIDSASVSFETRNGGNPANSQSNIAVSELLQLLPEFNHIILTSPQNQFFGSDNANLSLTPSKLISLEHKPSTLRFKPAELSVQFKCLQHKYIPEEEWLEPIARSVIVINESEISILQDLFSVLSNATPIEKLVINYVNKFIELEDALNVLITPKEEQPLVGYYKPQANFIEVFFQQDMTKLKGTLMHELVHYLIQKSFGQSIPHTSTNGFMAIVKSVIFYVNSHMKQDDSRDEVSIQEQFFNPLQDISAKNSIVSLDTLELIKSKFDPDELHLDDFNNLIVFSNACGEHYPTFGHILEEMLPRSFTLISKFQERNNNSLNTIPEFLKPALDFVYSGFNNEINYAIEDMIGSYCQQLVGGVLDKIVDDL